MKNFKNRFKQLSDIKRQIEKILVSIISNSFTFSYPRTGIIFYSIKICTVIVFHGTFPAGVPNEQIWNQSTSTSRLSYFFLREHVEIDI